MAEILIHDEVQLLDWGESRAGGPWIKLRLNDPEQLETFRGMDTPTAKKTGHILNITITVGDIIPAKEEKEPVFGEYAKELKKSRFFYNSKIWPHVGTDEEYREWVQRQPSCLSGSGDWVAELGEERCEAAHVRRSDESGAGIKAEYACVPLTRKEHQIQHDNGEASLLNEINHTKLDEQSAKGWFDVQRFKYLEKWCWEKLKGDFGYESWADVPPNVLRDWAVGNNTFKYLPRCYQKYCAVPE